MENRHKYLLIIGLLVVMPVLAGENKDRWWPVQTLPKALVRTPCQEEFPEPRAAMKMMVQSAAGLAAKAVNEGRGDEMVWIGFGNVDAEDWYVRMLAMHPDLSERGVFGPWELVDRYTKQGIIKGYILYRLDKSKGENNSWRSGIDYSVNVATSLAGLLDGIIVDEELEKEAKAHGLKLLLDVREKTQAWCFKTYKDRFNRRMLCIQDPRAPHVRDLAIAQKVFTLYGNDQPTEAAMKCLEPLSPILGWNCGDEFENTDISTVYGHIQTATNWCMNLPVLMAGTEKLSPPKAKDFDPNTIDWSDKHSAVSFIDTDGDNVQWLQGNFFRSADEGQSYWGNPDRGKIPFGWSCCFAQLAQLCPQAIDYAIETRSPNDWFVEWGGGYYYPDRFGLKRANRWELLGQHARRTWELMEKTGTRIIGFNVSQYDSADARKAYQVIAGQTDGLLAILVFQYSAYEAGAGQTFWVKDRNGIELPVVTARYSIWENQNKRERSGTPAKIAREIRETIARTLPEKLPRYDWIIAHVWSYFKNAPGSDENAENIRQENGTAQGGVRGYWPVVWCARRLPADIRVISPEELIWRIRMQHNPSETKQFRSLFH